MLNPGFTNSTEQIESLVEAVYTVLNGIALLINITFESMQLSNEFLWIELVCLGFEDQFKHF